MKALCTWEKNGKKNGKNGKKREKRKKTEKTEKNVKGIECNLLILYFSCKREKDYDDGNA